MQTTRSGLFFFLFSLFVIWESWKVGIDTLKVPGTGFMAFLTGIALAFLSLLLIYQERKKLQEKVELPKRVMLALLFLFIYSFLLSPLGFYIATFFLLLCLFRLGEARSWWVITGMSTVVIVLVYVVFGRLLKVYFPPGIFGI